MDMSFERRVVAFVDVLGFKNLVLAAERGDVQAERSLDALITTLNSHVRFDNQSMSAPTAARPHYLVMSDSIVLSVPERHAENGRVYEGIVIVCAKVIQLAHTLLEGGTLVRGSVHVGPVKLDTANIFGSGYMRAYLGELIAWSPRVVLSTAAQDAYARVGDEFGKLVLPDGDDVIVNMLEPAYSRTILAGVYEEDVMSQYRAHITDNLSRHARYGGVWIHWAWMADYFNKALTRNKHHNVEPIALPPGWKIALAAHRVRHLPERLYAKRQIAKLTAAQ